VVDQMLVGVATRRYARSLEPVPATMRSRGTSKSAVSRRFVAKTAVQLAAWRTASLEALDLVGLLIDGVHIGDHCLVVALEVAAAKQCGELSIAVPEIKDHGERLVLLRVRNDEVQQKTLAAAGRTQYERMPNVLDVKIERIRCVVRRLEDRQSLSLKVCVDSISLVEGENEAQVGRIRL
jgi:hypothetical protein